MDESEREPSDRVDSLKRKFEACDDEKENKMRKIPSLLALQNRPNVKQEAEKHKLLMQRIYPSHNPDRKIESISSSGHVLRLVSQTRVGSISTVARKGRGLL